eukprot:CAMPEP_0204329086 /NCGR_PEP_ID=MMETSP0469-20131031/13887_1 /ASSEMBLY_ACC=CAM_ASM_000384 /TAXON_ID=2969 /ORGANISM="Oxyrrhis marina" /LENGTH=62 /DNA_ID=CAMNT_0051311621 /DNA_START=9 /DNA_END=194 /DNA_ORIENTATION=+
MKRAGPGRWLAGARRAPRAAAWDWALHARGSGLRQGVLCSGQRPETGPGSLRTKAGSGVGPC